jgi:filamentous hemagglutinin family protein
MGRQLGLKGWRTVRNLSGLVYAAVVQGTAATAQPIPDNTLPTNTTVIPDPGSQNRFLIEGGTPAGANLFHSFESFSVPSDGAVVFRPDPSIQFLFSRVTGNDISNIDGQLRVEGRADFFLLNPNGIVFGPKASLDVGGSFVVSTASAIKFNDNSVLSTTASNGNAILSITTPIGLQFGSVPGTISVQPSPPTPKGNQSRGLQVEAGKTFALLGGPINIAGGKINSPQSQIELASLGGESFVTLAPIGSRYAINYDAIQRFQDINISQLAEIDTSGEAGGLIRLQGNNITVSGGSQIISDTQGNGRGAGITINATDRFEILGTGPKDGPLDVRLALLGVKIPQRSRVSSGSRVLSGAQAKAGTSGDISIQAGLVSIRDGAELSVTAQGNGTVGKLVIQASNAIEVLGDAELLGYDLERLKEKFPPNDADPLSDVGRLPFFAKGFTASVITSTGEEADTSQDLTLDAPRIIVRDGGIINAGPLGSGTGGNIYIYASEAVEISGTDKSEAYPSAITVAVLSRKPGGSPGNLLIKTPILRILDGARIGLDTTSDSGALGDIKASELVEITGISATGRFKSQISGQSTLAGTGGQVNLTTNQLRLTDGGNIFVQGVSASEGGNIKITANSVVLDNQAELSAGSNSGIQGGNINLQVRDNLILRRNSKISAQAGNKAKGGNISISANLIAAASDENSDIIANAFAGEGGRIDITAKGILGLEVSQTLTARSDINASSAVGVDGSVTINSPSIDLDSTQTKLNDTAAEPSLSQECLVARTRQDSFIYTGRGGLPITPSTAVTADSLWQDLLPLTQLSAQRGSTATATATKQIAQRFEPKTAPRLIEAQAWKVAPNGLIQLVSQDPNAVGVNPSPPATCSATSIHRSERA